MLFLLVLLAILCSALSINNHELVQISPAVDHSETPSWDGRNNILYFVNIHAGEIYRYHMDGRLTKIKLDGEVAPVIPSKANPDLLIIGLNRSIVAVQWNEQTNRKIGDVRILTTVSRMFPTSRFNDGKADKNGRLWIGTMGHEGPEGLRPNEGVLYRVTCDSLANPRPVIVPVNISNGAAFNKANDKYYYIDTPTRTVVEYKFDVVKGEISNRRVVFDVRDHSNITGSPDGMTIDDQDNLWVALYGGSAVVHVNSTTGQLLQVVSIPARDVTSVMWGGRNLDELFVTSSRYKLNEQERKAQPAAGAVFVVRKLGARGLPMFNVDLIDSLEDKKCGAGLL